MGLCCRIFTKSPNFIPDDAPTPWHGGGFYSVAESRGPFSHWLAFVVNYQTTETPKPWTYV
jgi:hypothetical protein